MQLSLTLRRDKMSLIKVLWTTGFGEGDALRIMDDTETKHFCYNCRKLIHNGEQFIEHWFPKPFSRQTKYSYSHKECPTK